MRFWQLPKMIAAALALCMAVPAAYLPVPAAAAEGPTMITLQTGQSVLLKTPGIERIAVGDGSIAGVVPLGSSQIVINGKSPGHTSVFVWYSGRRTTYQVTVTQQQVDDLARMIRTSIANPAIEVVSFDHSVIVRGTVRDGAAFSSVADLLGRFKAVADAQRYSLVNAVQIARPLGDLQRDIAAIPGASDIRVDPDGKGNVIVSGRVHDLVTEQSILQRARGLSGQYLSSDGKLIDRLSVDTISEIDVKVYVLEVDKTAASTLGIDLQSATFSSNCIYTPSCFTTGPPNFPVVEAPQQGGGALKVGPFFRVSTLAPTLHLLMTEGHAKVLSAPDLVTTNGNPASFLVGGQFPIPYSTGLGQVSITYEPFGVQLNVTPTVLGNGAVEAKIAPDISDLDFQDGVSENGFLIPALKESKLATDVVTQPGESVIMGGMVRHVESRFLSKIPLLSSIPILGKLFQSTAYQNNESDVVFVMTPEIISR